MQFADVPTYVSTSTRATTAVFLQGVLRGSTFLRMEVCRSPNNTSTEFRDASQKPVAAIALTLNMQTMQSITALRSSNSSPLAGIWPSISQMLVSVDVCPRAKPSRAEAEQARAGPGQGMSDGGIAYVRLMGDLQALLEAHGMQPFASRRHMRTQRSTPLIQVLDAGGFPSMICRYSISLARHPPAPDEDGDACPWHADDGMAPWQMVSPAGFAYERAEESQIGRTRLLGQVHVCSPARSLFLDMAPDLEYHARVSAGGERRDPRAHGLAGVPREALRFPGSGNVSSLASDLPAGSIRCHEACLKESTCRSWSYWGANVSQTGSAHDSGGAGQRGRAAVCVGCRESSWFPLTHAGCASGLVVERFMKGEEIGVAGEGGSFSHGQEPFYLNLEPKGGWTMTDLVGFPFSSDADMLHARWPSPADYIARRHGSEHGGRCRSSVDGAASGAAPRGEEDSSQAGISRSEFDGVSEEGAGAEEGGAQRCGGKPRAAVVYLVGHREQDLVALEESIAALERWLLLPHGNCYPIFLFAESWGGASGAGSTAVQVRIRAAAAAPRTRRQMEFLVADLSFPAEFDPAQHASPQSKRSAWGYQHMSRFWARTIFEHARVAALEFYLRLDTDSLLLSPLLDVFEDAARRGVKYGYRMAGKDWRGRNVGLWSFHEGFLRNSGRVQPCAGRKLCRDQVVGGGDDGLDGGQEDARRGGQEEEDCCREDWGSLLTVARGSRRASGRGGFNLGDETEAPMLYTNMELVDVRRFRSADVWAFVEAIDASHGIYVHNWGDAQIRWLEVATFLRDDEVHRYCHFGYQHAAAAARAFECWQEAWVGFDCADPRGCDLRGRSRRRLVDQERAAMLIGPPVSPARTHELVVEVRLPPRCLFVGDLAGSGERGDERQGGGDAHAAPREHPRTGLGSAAPPSANRFRAFWLLPPGAAAGGRLQPQGREVEISSGRITLAPSTRGASEDSVAALVVVSLRGGEGAAEGAPGAGDSNHDGTAGGDEDMQRAALAATALVVEVEMVYLDLDGGAAGKEGRPDGGGGEEEVEQGLIVFPTEQTCAQRIAGPCRFEERLQGDMTRVTGSWAPPDSGVMRSLRGRASGGGDGLEGDVDIEGRGLQWQAVMVRVLLPLLALPIGPLGPPPPILPTRLPA